MNAKPFTTIQGQLAKEFLLTMGSDPWIRKYLSYVFVYGGYKVSMSYQHTHFMSVIKKWIASDDCVYSITFDKNNVAIASIDLHDHHLDNIPIQKLFANLDETTPLSITSQMKIECDREALERSLLLIMLNSTIIDDKLSLSFTQVMSELLFKKFRMNQNGQDEWTNLIELEDEQHTTYVCGLFYPTGKIKTPWDTSDVKKVWLEQGDAITLELTEVNNIELKISGRMINDEEIHHRFPRFATIWSLLDVKTVKLEKTSYQYIKNPHNSQDLYRTLLSVLSTLDGTTIIE